MLLWSLVDYLLIRDLSNFEELNEAEFTKD